MYAEAIWWRCHRRIITDYLLPEEELFYIPGRNQMPKRT